MTNEDDFDLDAILNEDNDSPIEEDPIVEKKVTKKKAKRKPSGEAKEKEVNEVPAEIANLEKELLSMEWQQVSQPAFDGYQNVVTGEAIDTKEAIRRTLCYAQEAARNSR